MDEPSLKRVNVTVDQIKLIGLDKTNETLVRNHVNFIKESVNFHDLLKNLSLAKDDLLSFGVFSSIQCLVDYNKEKDVYDISFNIDESKQINGSMNFTTSSDIRANAGFNGMFRNMFGKAENLSFYQTYNTDRYLESKFVFSKPSEKTPNLKYLLSLSKSVLDGHWSKFRLHSVNLIPEVQYRTLLGHHQIFGTLCCRETIVQDITAPLSIREESGNQMKNSLSYIFKMDTKPAELYPETGHTFKLRTDVSILTPGDISKLSDRDVHPSEDKAILARIKARFSKSFGISQNFCGEFLSSFGLIHSIYGHKVPIADRFFLGGPLTLRGFSNCGVGPMARQLAPFGSNLTKSFNESRLSNNPIGDCGFWLSSLHIYSRLPYFSKDPNSIASLFRIQGFLSAGSTFQDPLASMHNGVSVTDSLRNIISLPRYSAGIGLSLKLGGSIRLELNYCLPLKFNQTDFSVSGIQYGFGLIYV